MPHGLQMNLLERETILLQERNIIRFLLGRLILVVPIE
jgi:hypothetical protein